MKEKRSPNNKEKARSAARPDTRVERKLQEKNVGRNLKPKEMNKKPSADKPVTNNTLVNDTKADENMIVNYVDDAGVSEEIVDESDAETTNDSVSSTGDSQWMMPVS
ncbi:hypothetical protein CASFOL_000431 [Castilleja foliolosa]|uniref:Uncharacterized protein n=1 Tax=Castilleja foliolosa TaxID=1961234 RepID=A0ABD3ESP4_9LAMI